MDFINAQTAGVIAQVLPVFLLVTMASGSYFFPGPLMGPGMKAFVTIQYMSIFFGEGLAVAAAGDDAFADEWQWFIWGAFLLTLFLAGLDALSRLWGVSMWGQQRQDRLPQGD